MRFVEPDDARVWLVGGGLTQPWSFGELRRASARADVGGPYVGVADLLLRLTRALRSGAEIDLGEGSFSGEGLPPAGDGAAVTQANDWRFHADAVLTLRTSGTTGPAARVRHRAGSLWRNVIVDSRHADAVWGLAFNPSHIAGVQVYLQALANGNTIVNLWGVSWAEVVERCESWGVTHLSGTPTFYRLLLALEQRLPRLRSVSIGGERVDAGLIARLQQQFPEAKVRNIYASTEAGSLFVTASDEFEVPARLANRVRCDEGRLWLHRDLVAGEAHTNEALSLLRQDHGAQARSARTQFMSVSSGSVEWHDTGDLVAITCVEPLRFRIVGRAAGWINVGGEKINPGEVEDALLAHPKVAAARIYGRKNCVTGQLLAADVVPRAPTPAIEELNAFVRERLPPHKRPRIIRFVDTLQVARTGKMAP